MATFRTGQQTHQAVLPRPTRRPSPPSTDASGAVLVLALESVPAAPTANGGTHPRIGNETGHGHHRHAVVPGVEHGRGETTSTSPGAGGVTPNPEVGEQHREVHTIHQSVFVLDKHGHPLQPCPPAGARKLLAEGRAVVARHTPFTIRLKDRAVAESEVDGVEIGIYPGSKHTGIAVFTTRAGERRGRFSVQLDRGGVRIKKRMGRRAAYRGRRRSANPRYRAPRFNNRTRPKERLPPSPKHRVDTTTACVDRLARWALWRALDQRLSTHAGSSGRTKWSRTRNQPPKPHALDALAVGEVETITHTVATILVVGCSGRGFYARTRPDKHGFPRLRLPRTERFFSFATGDLVRAVVPEGKRTGTYTGRVAVRATGSFDITTTHGTVQGIGHRYVRLLQRADGYAYTTRKEQGVYSWP